MILLVMPEFLHALKLFDSAIDSFMSASGVLFHQIFVHVIAIVRRRGMSIATIASVSFYLFTRTEKAFEFISEY